MISNLRCLSNFFFGNNPHYSVLAKLIDNLLFLIQFITLVNSKFTLFCSSFKLLLHIVKFVSSANSFTLNLVSEGRSFIYNKNKSGPKVTKEKEEETTASQVY